jgi:hypothetical protein
MAHTMRNFVRLLVVLVLILSGCSDDEPILDRIQYQWPQWSNDGSFVMSRYYFNQAPGSAVSTKTFSIHDRASGSEKLIDVTTSSAEEPARFWIHPGDKSVVLGRRSLTVVGIPDVILHGILDVPSAVKAPSYIAFSADAGGYYWVNLVSPTFIAYTNNYDAQSLQPSSFAVLMDSATGAEARDIIATREDECAVLLSNGSIMRVNNAGELVETYTISEHSSTDPGFSRIRYLRSASGTPSASTPDFIYYVDESGLARINLVTGDHMLLVGGQTGFITNFDVNESTRNILFITSGHQVWLGSENGAPLSLLLYEHHMASLSPDGKSVAAVTYTNGKQESLTILQFKK